ncbi:hypothetical protein GK047_14845 [Paenibacillus sp. SYP-B3998]|uniref:Pectate lyase superfamily protein domain-containing protein n=1 Tax=Paenibacillus sp. SYP-B3998 TaxID=2678564 RepID=A0A6G3ZYJ3_9BACL|nr:right-handed parallel beta-helix repeat-containing protein [Paenibacillus sp. SYP-B3998]NEW07283.1 hypothetical protein [Paenibacillus sp. SYP-B3998]
MALAVGGLLKENTAQAMSPSSPILNVKDFGAKGNSRPDEDDAPYIQSALDSASLSGGVVFIPAGMYWLKSPLRVSSNITLIGSGSNAILRSTMNKFSVLHLSTVNHVHIHNIAFQGLGTFATSYVPRLESGITLNKAADVRITDCVFSMIDNGVTSVDSSRVHIENCTFDNLIGALDFDSQGHGVWCSNATDHSIQHNHFNMLFQSCISLTNGTSNSRISGNHMQKCYQSGIDIISLPTEAACKQNTISDNIVESFLNSSGKTGYTYGVRLRGNCVSNLIIGNTLTDIDDYAIKCEAKGVSEKERPRFNTFADNQIHDVRNTGIVILNSYDNRISGNSIRDCKVDGIILYAEGKEQNSFCSNNQIVTNTINRCGKSPIRIADTKCVNTILYGNIGSGNGDKIVDNGTTTTTSAL